MWVPICDRKFALIGYMCEREREKRARERERKKSTRYVRGEREATSTYVLNS